jgi:hypothetical protein
MTDDIVDLNVQGVTDAGRCPLDGAPLRSWSHQANGPSTYVHADGTTHGGLVEFAETWAATLAETMAKLREALEPALAELNASAQRAVAALQAIEWPRFPPVKADTEGDRP